MTDGRPGWRSRSSRGMPLAALALWPFKGDPVVLGVNRWAAGGLALCSIIRGIVDGGDTTKVREFVRWLTPDDFIKTEHLIMLDALKGIVDADEGLTLDRIAAGIFPDRIDIGRIEVNSYLSRRHEAPSPDDGPEFAELMEILEGLREARHRERMEARRAAVPVARSVLAGTTGLIDGAKRLAWVENEFDAGERPTFEVFADLLVAVEHCPKHPFRKNWSEQALARKDAELDTIKREAWPDVERACSELVRRWSDG